MTHVDSAAGPAGIGTATDDEPLPSVGIPDRTGPSGSSGTTIPRREPAGPAPRRRQLGGVARHDVLNVVGAVVGGFATASLLFGRLAPFSGLIGYVVVSYVAFLTIYAVLVAQQEEGPAIVDRVMTVFLWSAFLLVLGTLLSVVPFIVVRGAPALPHLNFYTQDLSRTGGLAPLTVGGISHAIAGTLWTIAIALGITVPIGLIGAFYLTESRSPLSRFVRIIVEAMVALPDIIAGLFIYSTWILILHFRPSGFAAALALSVAMLPIIVRSADVVLRLVPGNLREASAALGAPSWRTALHVTLPTARSGLATAVILGTARGIGETAPVLLTAGYTLYFNNNPLNGPMVTLPLLSLIAVRGGLHNMTIRAFGAATFLFALVLILFVTARLIGGRGPGHQTKRGRVRAARRSAQDAARFSARGGLRPQRENG